MPSPVTRLDIVQKIKAERDYRRPLDTERPKPEYGTLELQGVGGIELHEPTYEDMAKSPGWTIAGLLWRILRTLPAFYQLGQDMLIELRKERPVSVGQAQIPTIPSDGIHGIIPPPKLSQRQKALDWLRSNEWQGAVDAKPLMETDGLTIGIGTIQRAINELRKEGW